MADPKPTVKIPPAPYATHERVVLNVIRVALVIYFIYGCHFGLVPLLVLDSTASITASAGCFSAAYASEQGAAREESILAAFRWMLNLMFPTLSSQNKSHLPCFREAFSFIVIVFELILMI